MRYNPFNPQVPAQPEFFVGRHGEIQTFERNLFQTTRNSPMSMAVVGNRGIGKTSLLSKFYQKSKAQNALVARISNFEGNTRNITDLAELIITELRMEYLSSGNAELSDHAKKFLASLSIKLSLGGVDVDVSLKKQEATIIFRNKLVDFWGHIKAQYDSVVILIDEAESIERIEGSLMFLREVFQRLSEIPVPYMIVLCGKLNFPETMSEAFSPLNRFFPSTRLLYLSQDETTEFLKKSLKVVDCTIDEGATKIIYEKTKGHPYMVVSMAYNIFNNLPETKSSITEEIVSGCIDFCEARLEQDYFLSLYHPLTPKCKEILLKLANKLNTPKFTFGQAVAILKMDGYYVSPYIQEMYRKGCLNKLERGKYEIFHELFLTFLKRRASILT